jgi:hypothetical protein
MEESVQKEAEEQLSLKVSNMLKASKLCFDNECWEAGVILLYSLIDAMAWLRRDPSHPDVTGPDFREWVERYMLPAPGIHVSAEDLYGARCGMLHSLTGESKKHRNLEARKVGYLRTVPEGVRWLVQIHMAETLEPYSVDVDVLGEAILQGINKFCDEINGNPELNERVSQRVFTSYFSEGWMMKPPMQRPGLESGSGPSLGAVVVVRENSARPAEIERSPQAVSEPQTSEPASSTDASTPERANPRAITD